MCTILFRGPLLTEDYSAEIRELYLKFCEKLNYIPFWEMLKMEIRNAKISFAKRKAKVSRNREAEIKEQLDDLDQKTCNSRNLENVNSEAQIVLRRERQSRDI